MKINITETRFFQGRSGIGMRCTLSLIYEDPIRGQLVQTVSGCLAIRNKKEKMCILTPIIYIGPARIRHRPFTLSPNLAEWVEAEIEKGYGKKIHRNPSKGSAVEFTPASEYGLPEMLELIAGEEAS